MCMPLCAHVCGGLKLTFHIFLDGSPPDLLRHGLSLNPGLANDDLHSCPAFPRHPPPHTHTTANPTPKNWIDITGSPKVSG